MTTALVSLIYKTCLGCGKTLAAPAPWNWYCQSCPGRALTIGTTSSDPTAPTAANPLAKVKVNRGTIRPVKGQARVTCTRCHRRPKEDKNSVCRSCAAHDRNGGDYDGTSGCRVRGCDRCWRKRPRHPRETDPDYTGGGGQAEYYDTLPADNPLVELEGLLNAWGPDQTLQYMGEQERFDHFQPWIGQGGEFYIYDKNTYEETEIIYSGKSAYARDPVPMVLPGPAE